MSELSVSQFPDLRRQLGFAYENVPLAKQLFESAGMTPHDIRDPGDFLAFPSTNKSVYRRNFPMKVLARGRSLSEDSIFTVTSSGTTDERLTSAHSRGLAAHRYFEGVQLNAAFLEFYEKRARVRQCYYVPPMCSAVECSNPYASMKDRTLPNGDLVLPSTHNFMATSDERVDQLISEILEYKPDLITCDPQRMAFLVRQLKRRGIALEGVGCILTMYTQLTPVERTQIRSFFPDSVVLVNAIGMTEFGMLAAECTSGSHHLNHNSYYFELLADGRHTEAGQVGELVVTSLFDEVAPYLRYATGDLYELVPGRCACGSSAPMVKLHGRASQRLVTADGGLVTIREFSDRFGAPSGVAIYQVRQREDRRCQVSVVALDDEQPDPGLLISLVQNVLGKLHVDIDVVEQIPCLSSGKFAIGQAS